MGLSLKTASDNNQKKLLDQLINQDRRILMENTLLSKITQSDYERARVMERERILTDYYSFHFPANLRDLVKPI